MHKLTYKYKCTILNELSENQDFPGGPVVKNPPANAGDTGSILGPERFPHAAKRLSPCATTTEPAL